MNTGLFVTAQRSTVVEFSRPIWALSDGFIVRADTSKPPSSYASLAAEPAARLGVVQATVQRQTALQAGIPSERIVEYTTQDQAVAGLLAGQIDAYASTALGHRAFVRRAADTRLAVVDAVVAPHTGAPTMPPVGAFSFAKAQRDLRQAVDAFLKSYLGSEAHRRLMRAYGFTDADIDWVAAPHP
jgi:polar amino acid transport system substrate-binding protein